MRSVAVVFIAACAGHAPPPTQSPAPQQAPPVCDRMADHLVSLIGESTKATPEQLDPFRRVLAARCTQDQWSAQAQQCMLDSKTLDDGDKCEPLFTPQQKEALQRDGETALGVLKQAPPAGAPAGAPAEGAAPPSPTRGSHRAGDPCEGGE